MLPKTWSLFSFISEKNYFVEVLPDADCAMIIEAKQNVGYRDVKITKDWFIQKYEKARRTLEFAANLGQNL
jgi:hypothetical protein